MARDVQSGQIALKTPGGNDTVANKLGEALAQQVMPQQMIPSGMRNAVENAGIAGQIQANDLMGQQEALRKLAAQQAAAERNAPPIDPAAMGIATAPGAQAVQMAEGGIAGYAGDEESAVIDAPMGGSSVGPEFDTGAGIPTVRAVPTREEGDRIADLIISTQGKVDAGTMQAIRAGTYGSTVAEARSKLGLDVPAPAAAAPVKPEIQRGPSAADISGLMSLFSAKPTPIDLSEAKGYRAKAERQFTDIDTAAPSPEQISTQEAQTRAATEAMLRAQGIDPNFVAASQEEDRKRTAAKVQQAQEIIDRTTAEQKRQGLIDFLLGASGFQGEGLGQTLKTGALSAQAAGEARQRQIDQQRQAQLEYQDAAAKEAFLKDKFRYETAMGRWDKANDTLMDLKKAANDKRTAGVRMYTAFAGAAADEGIARAQMQSRANAANAAAASRIFSAMTKGGGKPLSVKDEKMLADMKTEAFFSPMAISKPEFRRFISQMPNGQQVLNDIAEGRIKFENGRWIGPGKKPVEAIERAADLYEATLRGRVGGSGGAAPTPYTQAESELD